jgi:hypothetical protein
MVRQLLELSSPATDLLWAEDGSLYVPSASGEMTVLEHVLQQDLETTATAKGISSLSSTGNNTDDVAKLATGASTEQDSSHIATPAHRLSKLSKAEKEDDLDDDDDDIDFSQHDSSPAVKNKFVDDEAADDDDSIQSKQTADYPTNNENNRDNASDSDDDDDASLAQMPKYSNHNVISAEPQPAFAPSSSPLDLPRRFLCWNHIGSIVLHRDTGAAASFVDIQFTASAVTRPISFTDNLGFILGSLGRDGGIFATDVADDDGFHDDPEVDKNLTDVAFRLEATRAVLRNKTRRPPTGSTVYFHRFETIGALRDKDWYLTLPDGERAVGCAAGDGWAAVMTR